jgi:hypothetical protein
MVNKVSRYTVGFPRELSTNKRSNQLVCSLLATRVESLVRCPPSYHLLAYRDSYAHESGADATKGLWNSDPG